MISLSDINTNACKSASATGNSNKSVSKAGRKKRHIASASTALLFGTILGLLQAATLVFAAKPLLGAMGVKSVSVFLIKRVSYVTYISLLIKSYFSNLLLRGAVSNLCRVLLC